MRSHCSNDEPALDTYAFAALYLSGSRTTGSQASVRYPANSRANMRACCMAREMEERHSENPYICPRCCINGMTYKKIHCICRAYKKKAARGRHSTFGCCIWKYGYINKSKRHEMPLVGLEPAKRSVTGKCHCAVCIRTI